MSSNHSSVGGSPLDESLPVAGTFSNPISHLSRRLSGSGSVGTTATEIPPPPPIEKREITEKPSEQTAEKSQKTPDAQPAPRSPIDEFFEVTMSRASLSNSCSDNGSHRQASESAETLAAQEVTFTVKVTALLMGLKTMYITVRPSTTVLQLKELIQNSDDSSPPPDRQRVTYNNEELSDDEATLNALNPPACEGAKFSMAVELKIEPFFEEIEVSVIHYHGYTDTITMPKDGDVAAVIAGLTERDSEKWLNGKMMVGDDDIADEAELLSIPTPEPGKVTLQFFPLPNYNGVAQPEELDVQYNGVRMNADSAPASPVSGMIFFCPHFKKKKLYRNVV